MYSLIKMPLLLSTFYKFPLSFKHTIFVCIKMPLLLLTFYKFLLPFCHVIFAAFMCIDAYIAVEIFH